MAQRTVLVDDLNGETADETVTFALDGVSYEIDLSEANVQKLRDVLAPYVGQARKAGEGRSSGPGRPRARTSPRPARSGNTAEIREWAKANGYQVSERGRIPAPIQEAYDKAQAS